MAVKMERENSSDSMVYNSPGFTEFLHHNDRLQSRVIVSLNNGQILFITSNRNMMIVIPVFNLHNKYH